VTEVLRALLALVRPEEAAAPAERAPWSP